MATTTETPETYSALYYPYIHFRSTNWLKRSILFWDKINRIIPFDPESGMKLEPDDNHTVQALSHLITPITPQLDHLDSVGAAFSNAIKQNALGLSQRYSIANIQSFPKASSPPKYFKKPEHWNCRLAYVACGKMSAELRRTLFDQNLVDDKLIYETGGYFLGMHRDLANIYMLELARQQAEKNLGLRLLTDDKHFHIGSGFAIGNLVKSLRSNNILRQKPTRQDVAGYLASFAIKMQIPKLSNVPIDEILKFREKNLVQMKLFRATLEKTINAKLNVRGLRKESDLKELVLTIYKEDIEPRLKQLEQLYVGLGWDMFTQVLLYSPKAFLTDSVAFFTNSYDAMLLGGAKYTLGLIPAAKVLQDRGAQIRPVAYLVHAREQLSAKDTTSALARAARDFAFNIRQS